MSFRRLFRQLAASLAYYCLLGQLLPTWAAAAPNQVTAINPPATSLVLCDPYFSIWLSAAKLADTDTSHWTGKSHRFTSQVSIDGKTYRLIGREPAQVPALEETSKQIRLTYTVRATDGRSHDVRLYFEASAELVVNVPEQAANGAVERAGDLVTLKLGSVEQPIREHRGDDIVVACVLLLALQSVAADEPTSPQANTDGWYSLFNGLVPERSKLLSSIARGQD